MSRTECLKEHFVGRLVEILQSSQPMAERRRGQTSSKPQSSRLHSRVSSALQQLGVRHTNEQEVLGGVFYIDIALEGGVAIEVDGPSHFVDGTMQRNPETLFRTRVLEKLGWKVVSVPFRDWEGLMGRHDLQAGYLSEKLRALGMKVNPVPFTQRSPSSSPNRTPSPNWRGKS